MQLNNDTTMTIEIVIHDKHGDDFSARRRIRHEIEVPIKSAVMAEDDAPDSGVLSDTHRESLRGTRTDIHQGATSAAEAVWRAYNDILATRAAALYKAAQDNNAEQVA